jgi:hypothetical protein
VAIGCFSSAIAIAQNKVDDPITRYSSFCSLILKNDAGESIKS